MKHMSGCLGRIMLEWHVLLCLVSFGVNGVVCGMVRLVVKVLCGCVEVSWVMTMINCVAGQRLRPGLLATASDRMIGLRAW